MQKTGMEESNYEQICTSIVNFIPLEKIGEGSFSSVYKVRRINRSSYLRAQESKDILNCR